MVDSATNLNDDKRLAIVIDSMSGGGAERACLELSKYLLQTGFTVDLILCEFSGDRLQHIPLDVNLFVIDKKPQRNHSLEFCSIPKDQINWIAPKTSISISDFLFHVVSNWPFGLKIIPTRKGNRSFRAQAFSDYLRQHPPPNLVVAMLEYAVFCALIGRDISGVHVPIICSVRVSIQNSNHRYFNTHRKLLRKADWVHTVSTGLRTELIELNWVDGKRTTTIYNSVNSEQILSLSKRPSGHPWLDQKDRSNYKVVLTVGRLHPRQKNHPLLIHSIASIYRIKNVRLIILGEGSQRAALQSLVLQLGIVDIVSMPGWTSNPYSFMARADVFALSTNFEGLPNVLYEALACGCNIVSTDCPHGPKEVLDNGKFGKLVPIGNESAMTEAIADALNKTQNSENLMARAKEYSSERQITEFQILIGRVMSLSP